MHIVQRVKFFGALLRSYAGSRNFGTLRVELVERRPLAPMRHRNDRAKSLGILMRLRYGREPTVQLQSCSIREMRLANNFLPASKPDDHPDRICFSSDQVQILPDPPAHESGGELAQDPNSKELSLPNSMRWLT